MKPGRRRFQSLQLRLLVPLLGLVALIWLGSTIMSIGEASDEVGDLLDGHLAQTAGLLVAHQSQLNQDETKGLAAAPSVNKYDRQVAFQVFHNGTLAMRSANAGLTPMSPKDHGFKTVQMADGERWRVFSTRGAEPDVQIYVGEQAQARNAILWALLHSLLMPLLLALPLLALGGWWAVRQGLAPLRQLSHVLGQRRPHELKQVKLADLPTEMQPMVDALNALFERIETMVLSERRFTADAAHELRTPIAGIRAQAQVALGAGADAGQRQHALQATLAGCDRATRLVEQLLTLARLEAASDAGASAATRVDLCAVARRTAADLAPTALARHQTLELEASASCTVTGNDLLLGVLVRNLIDNALRYSPDGARIWVCVSSEAGQTLLRVEDSGPGMTASEMARLGERFYRVLGHERPGSGLGWSIVQRIAHLFNAQVQTSPSDLLGGLAVSVRWPVPSGAP